MPYDPLCEAGVRRSRSTCSIAASVTTYHSTRDTEQYDAAPAPEGAVHVESPRWKEDIFQPAPMRRHDSGYASIPVDSRSADSRGSGRRPSTTSSGSTRIRARLRTRHSIHRATISTGHRGSIASTRAPPRPRSQQHPSAYYPFPSLETPHDDPVYEPDHSYPPPPPTTHYWTSDHTRKLEYAAIDAASRGFRGWVLRHVVPDCFVPKQSRRLAFDDDTGSVRRYRLDLDCEDDTGKPCAGARGKKMGWLTGRS